MTCQLLGKAGTSHLGVHANPRDCEQMAIWMTAAKHLQEELAECVEHGSLSKAAGQAMAPLLHDLSWIAISATRAATAGTWSRSRRRSPTPSPLTSHLSPITRTLTLTSHLSPITLTLPLAHTLTLPLTSHLSPLASHLSPSPSPYRRHVVHARDGSQRREL